MPPDATPLLGTLGPDGIPQAEHMITEVTLTTTHLA